MAEADLVSAAPEAAMRPPASRIRLVVSDIDGTLVTNDKRLTPATIEAAQALREAGILLALVSARSARGMEMFLAPLGIDTPRAGLNGGEIIAADGTMLERLVIDADAAQRTIEMLDEHGVEPWVFGNGEWFVRNPAGAYVPKEHKAVRVDPVVLPNFDPVLGIAGKIMGSTSDYPLLERVEIELGAMLEGRVSAHRSQPYYLDVTHPAATKGHAALALAKILGVDPSEMACIGDMPNDIPMLREAGLAIAMGNADPAVPTHAHVVTETNEQDGWALAMRRDVLPRAPAPSAGDA